ncbi:hypothetical protein BKH20_08650 [Actinomyces oris]|uniref:Uncharacterized protein n=1 Tax=Actinomyces oris TaxID=544580 RepID=A0A1Q8WMN4_9ACTO|nr:hypothetical protein BKH20_08650 [Actinomyces oris]
MDAWDRRGQRRPQGATAVSPAADPSAQRRRPIMAHFRPYCCKVCNQWPGSQPDIFRSTGCSPRQVADPASPLGDTIIAYPPLQECNRSISSPSGASPPTPPPPARTGRGPGTTGVPGPRAAISRRSPPYGVRTHLRAEPTEPRRSQASTTRAAMPFSAALPQARGS